MLLVPLEALLWCLWLGGAAGGGGAGLSSSSELDSMSLRSSLDTCGREESEWTLDLLRWNESVSQTSQKTQLQIGACDAVSSVPLRSSDPAPPAGPPPPNTPEMVLPSGYLRVTDSIFPPSRQQVRVEKDKGESKLQQNDFATFVSVVK